ncbi:hypothetical protein [Algivirga pacifica]|uniref:Uncharacterized protein n=1 Tax=Algivirga pacifica TaxID=1162670 RepID=A0ABP9DDK8_9BACT
MKPKEIYEQLLAEKGQGSDFSEFDKHSKYQKERLYNVNYWLVQQGKSPIPVPESFEEYWDTLEGNLKACLEDE